MIRRDLAISAAQARAVDELVTAASEVGTVSVVRGPTGVGRTSTLDMVASRLAAAGVHVLTLRSHSGDAGRRQPLDGLDPSVWPSSGGVLVVDDADDLGEVEAAVVASMVAEGSASAVVAVSDGALPLAVTGLLRLTDPLSVTLVPLNADEAAALARRFLGGPVSPALGDELVAMTGGLPGRILDTVASWRDNGVIALHRSVWVAVGNLSSPSEPDHDPLTGFDEEQRRVVELCALARLIPLDRLDRMVDERVLVELERAGVVEVVGEGADERLRLRLTAMATSVERGLSPQRRKELLEEAIGLIEPVDGGEPSGDRELLDATFWRLELGWPVATETLLRAGQAALRLGDTRAVQPIARAAWSGTPTVDSALLMATALEVAGDLTGSLEVLREAWTLSGSLTDRSGLAARLVTAHLHVHEDPEATRQHAGELIAGMKDDGERAATSAAAAYATALSGEVDLAANLIVEVDAAVASNGVRAMATFVDLACRTMGGGSLRGWAPPPDDASGFGVLTPVDACRLFLIWRQVQLLGPASAIREAGALEEEARSRGAVVTQGWAAWLQAYGLLGEGRLFEARDAADRAWRLFVPMGLDSRLRAVLCLLDLIEALLAGSQGDDGAVPLPSGEGGFAAQLPSGSLWFFRGEKLRFSALARAVTDRDEGARQLVSASEELLASGLRVAAAWAHTEAGLLGQRAASAQSDALEAVVAEVASTTDDEPVDPDQRLLPPAAAAARALTSDAPTAGALLVEAIEALVDAGQLLHAHFALGTALGPDRSFSSEDRTALLALAARVSRLSDLSPVPARSAAGWELLSEGELAVARLVAKGLSNREAAEQLGRAKRTVDNTLGSVYRKLGIRDRSALALILGDT